MTPLSRERVAPGRIVLPQTRPDKVTGATGEGGGMVNTLNAQPSLGRLTYLHDSFHRGDHREGARNTSKHGSKPLDTNRGNN